MNALKELTHIINKDKKTATYKFALIRGVIESIHKYDHYCQIKDKKVSLPLGLMTLLWIKYYYPILSYKINIPQTTNPKLSFNDELKEVIKHYDKAIGYHDLIKQLNKGNCPESIADKIIALVKKINSTISRYPMQLIGESVGRQGEIFVYNEDRDYRKLNKNNLSINTIIKYCGTYTIDIDYYDTYKLLGAFINGENAIVFQWIDFSYRLMKDTSINKSELFSIINTYDETKRTTTEATKFFTTNINKNEIKCIWSGKTISKDLNIDHIIPFSLWGNNDLWNLLPSKAKVNGSKRDRIPKSSLLNKQKHEILKYWKLLHSHYPDRFTNEITHALCGEISEDKNLFEQSFDGLKAKCEFLISEQGYDSWML
ncbi:MAG: HNH endonuclease domain-containing protein [Marinifilaceae bacterium]